MEHTAQRLFSAQCLLATSRGGNRDFSRHATIDGVFMIACAQ
ncbi:hypothetical protein ACMYSK_12360 [Klebsiella sp. I138]